MAARPVLRRGDTGEWVRRLQEALAGAGFDPGPVDGDFGNRTEQAVRGFQTSRGLTVDGVVGPMTWDALGVAEPAGVGWPAVPADERMRVVMALLVEQYGYPVAGAAGVVGNLFAESGVIPQRIEGSAAATPMRASNFAGRVVDFTAEEIRDRNPQAGRGPRRPGVGLAQWTSAGRRSGLFQHPFQGAVPGAQVLFMMDAQVDYLAEEMRTSFKRVHDVVTDPGVGVDAASDEVVYNFEIPGSILQNGTKLPRSHPRVQQTFQARRPHSRRARTIYLDSLA